LGSVFETTTAGASPFGSVCDATVTGGGGGGPVAVAVAEAAVSVFSVGSDMLESIVVLQRSFFLIVEYYATSFNSILFLKLKRRDLLVMHYAYRLSS
jgi:hypothetical protein